MGNGMKTTVSSKSNTTRLVLASGNSSNDSHNPQHDEHCHDEKYDPRYRQMPAFRMSGSGAPTSRFRSAVIRLVVCSEAPPSDQ